MVSHFLDHQDFTDKFTHPYHTISELKNYIALNQDKFLGNLEPLTIGLKVHKKIRRYISEIIAFQLLTDKKYELEVGERVHKMKLSDELTKDFAKSINISDTSFTYSNLVEYCLNNLFEPLLDEAKMLKTYCLVNDGKFSVEKLDILSVLTETETDEPLKVDS
jgi:hypothetical protein